LQLARWTPVAKRGDNLPRLKDSRRAERLPWIARRANNARDPILKCRVRELDRDLPFDMKQKVSAGGVHGSTLVNSPWA
jgi:hypothetical protein